MSAPRLTSSSVDRRRFLEYVWWGAGSAMAMALMPGGTLKAAPRFASNPFTLGVASGDPTASGIVLWTRLAPDPADPTALGRAKIPVGWRVARDDSMRHVVAKGTASATPELAHSVHVEVNGLRSGADYFFQFDSGGEESAVGHFRTAPSARRLGGPAHLRRRHLPGLPERLLHGVPRHGPERPRPRAPPRRLHVRVRLRCLEPDRTRASRRSTRRRSTCAPTGSATRCTSSTRTCRRPTRRSRSSWSGTTTRCRTTTRGWRPSGGHRRRSSPPAGPPRTRRSTSTCRSACRVRRPADELRIYRRLNYGRLAEFTMLDDRQYRTDNPCGDGESLRCEAALGDDYTMLGRRQERWVSEGLDDSRARWSIVGQQLLLAELEHLPVRGRAVLERRLGRLPDGAPAPARNRRRRTRAQPGVLHRRLALDVRQRPQARLQGPDGADRRHRVRHPGDHHRRRRHAVRPVLRPDDARTTRTSSTTRATAAAT